MNSSTIVDFISGATVGASWIHYFWNLKSITNRVPISFDLHGNVNRYYPSWSFIIYPAITTATFFFSKLVQMRPSLINLPFKSHQNVTQQTSLAIRLMTDLQLLVGVPIFILQVLVVSLMKGERTSLPWLFSPFMFFSIVGRVGYYFFMAWKHK